MIDIDRLSVGASWITDRAHRPLQTKNPRGNSGVLFCAIRPGLCVQPVAPGAQAAGEAQHGDGGRAAFARFECCIAARLRLRVLDNAPVRLVANLGGLGLKSACHLHGSSSALVAIPKHVSTRNGCATAPMRRNSYKIFKSVAIAATDFTLSEFASSLVDSVL